MSGWPPCTHNRNSAWRCIDAAWEKPPWRHVFYVLWIVLLDAPVYFDGGRIVHVGGIGYETGKYTWEHLRFVGHLVNANALYMIEELIKQCRISCNNDNNNNKNDEPVEAVPLAGLVVLLPTCGQTLEAIVTSFVTLPTCWQAL